VAKKDRTAAPASPAPRGRRHKRREIGLADGGKIILNPEGSIERLAADGASQTWRRGDPEWPDYALRFGLKEQPPTVAPAGRFVTGTKPPRR
jgi:hypothetical protein